MALIVTRINVGDYDTWKTMFDHDEPVRDGARKEDTSCCSVDDPNEVFVVVEFSSIRRGQRRP